MIISTTSSSSLLLVFRHFLCRRGRRTTTIVSCAGLILLSGCAITLPPVSTSPDDPSNPQAAEAATAPLRPGLVAGAKTYLSSRAGADAQKMQHGGGDMGGMKGMEGMDHGPMEGMKDMPAVGSPQNPAEKEVTTELKQQAATQAAPVIPSTDQLESIHPAQYTCPMHPEVRSDKPGQCPKCGMALVTVASFEKNKAREEKKP